MRAAQDLNIQQAIIGSMGYSSYIESDERIPLGGDPDKGYSALDAATEVFSRLAKKGLYIVSANYRGVPALEGEEGVLRQISMGDKIDPESVDYLVNGLEAAKNVAGIINKQTGTSVGIAKYDGLAALAHIHAQEAIRKAEKMNKPFDIHKGRD